MKKQIVDNTTNISKLVWRLNIDTDSLIDYLVDCKYMCSLCCKYATTTYDKQSSLNQGAVNDRTNFET